LLSFVYIRPGQWKASSLPEEASYSVASPGDGFFETIRLGKNGFCPLAPFHADRIVRSASFFRFPDAFYEFSEARLREILNNLPLKDSGKDWRIKLLFYRYFDDSYSFNTDEFPLLHAYCREIEKPFFSYFRHIDIADSVTVFPASYGWIKSISALPYRLAAMERKAKAVEELVLCSPEGFVVEGSFTSVFWQDELGFHFTARDLGGIDSCLRRFLENHLQKQEFPFDEKRISFAHLMDQAYWIGFGSAMGIRLVSNRIKVRSIPEVLTSLPVSQFVPEDFNIY
jgi:branched-subunit amino acid aminotransferase/4-amino-4-deoxychorismate lyase